MNAGVFQRLMAAAVTCVICCAAGAALADQNDERLNAMFNRLHELDDPREAQQIELAIWQVWSESGSDTADLLLARGVRAMNGQDFELAMDAFTALIALEPEFAEGWNKRATLYYLMGEPAASIRDIEKTLELEPRHFGALSGLGLVHLAAENYPAALDAFEAALVVHPRMASAIRYVRELRLKLYGPEV